MPAQRTFGKGAALYIKTPEALAGFVQRASLASVLAVDTEFIREKTYYPRLCLVQLAARFDADEEYVLVDPLAIADISALNELFCDTRIVKVFHSCDQDVAILYHDLGCIPTPIFDTQRAAQLLGHVQQIGLGPMVRAYCGIRMDKGDTFTDWAQRPLRATQLRYAYDDVRYLPRIYQTMRTDLIELGRLSWLDEEFARLSDPETYAYDIHDAWRKVKHSANLKPRQLNALRELALWREKTAQERDYPRKWIVSDDILVEVARRLPASSDELYQVRGVREKLSRGWVEALLAAIRTAEQVPASEWPEPPRQIHGRRAEAAQIDLITTLVHQRAFENRIVSNILASPDEIVSLASGQRRGLKVLQGWRRAMVGAELEELLDGRICLSLEDGSLKVTRMDGGEL
jgi:ribonuclease D